MKQHSNTTGSLGFNGQDNGSEQSGYNSKYQHKAAGIPSAKANYGRGPTKGNTDGKKAGPSSATGKGQYRGQGGTAIPKCSDSINVGRGPTKGNQQ